MKFKKLLAGLGLAALVTVGTVVVAESPAAANAGFDACGYDQFCVYRDNSFGGPMYYYTTPQWTCVNIGGSWNNSISSVVNNRYFTVTLWDGAGCSGVSTSIDGIGGFWANYNSGLGGWPTLFNDRASSISFGW